MRRPRHLSPEERALWDRVARTAEPIRPPRPSEPSPEKPSPSGPPLGPPGPPPAMPQFRVGEKVDHRGSDDLLPGLAQRLSQAPVRMDARTMKRMGRGKLAPEGRIDLHGMTLAQAHSALTGFILMSRTMDRRLVLVITGKGRTRGDSDGDADPARQGALRHQVPQWLRLPPLADAVLQVAPAHRRHGGEGAYYVYLRRRR